jgi:pheromone shutdown protein TraB
MSGEHIQTETLKKQKAEWKRFAIEAFVTLAIHTGVAIIMIALIFIFARLHGDLLNSANGQFLFWSGVGLATGTTLSACAFMTMLIKKLVKK